MATFRSFLHCLFFIAVISIFQILATQAQPVAAPAPSPTSDGSAIDLGIAYALMVVALVVTYLMHPIDAFPFNLF